MEKESYIYHCHAICKSNDNKINYFDDLIKTENIIKTHEDYGRIKRHIAMTLSIPTGNIDDVTIDSLTFLHAV